MDSTWMPILSLHEMLLSPCTSTVEMYVGGEFKRKHMSNLIKVFAGNSKSLQSLKLDNHSGVRNFRCSPENHSHFESIFQSAKHLTKLALPKLCDDAVMKLVGENCTMLKFLDISGTRLVTCKGVHLLTQNIIRIESKNQQKNCSWKSSLWGLPNIFLPLEELVPKGESAEGYERKKSPICNTLKVLKLDKPMLRIITTQGLLMMLELVRNLESFGDVNMQFFFRELCSDWQRHELERKVVQLPSLNLISIHLSPTTTDEFKLMCGICPKLKHLTYEADKLYPKDCVNMSIFYYLQQPESLIISGTLISEEQDLVNAISIEARGSLRILKLKNEHFMRTVRLYSVFVQFPRLHKLTLCFSTFKWGAANLERSLLLENLSEIVLDGQVSAEAVVKMFERAPNLKDITMELIYDRPPDFVERLCRIRESTKLECFWLRCGNFVNRREDLAYFLNTFKNVRRVGRLSFPSFIGW